MSNLPSGVKVQMKEIISCGLQVFLKFQKNGFGKVVLEFDLTVSGLSKALLREFRRKIC